MIPLCLAAILVLLILVCGAAGLLGLALAGGLTAVVGGAAGPADSAQSGVFEKYQELRASAPAPYEKFCYPKTYSIQPPQQFVGEFMAPGTNNRELLVYHKIGAGKTCASIQIGERWKTSSSGGRPLFVMPASLIPGFRAELRTPCAGDTYLSADERVRLRTAPPGGSEYSAILAASDARIDASYNILSYNALASLHGEGRLPKAALLVVDEVQNVSNPGGKTFAALEALVAQTTGPVVLLTGTPVFDRPDELASIARLLRAPPPPDGLPTPEWVSAAFRGRVSFSAGAPDHTFPRATVDVVRVPMSRFQTKWYRSSVTAELSRRGGLKLLTAPNDFYIRSRQRANIVFPRGLSKAAGLAALTPGKIRKSLPTYSAKFADLIGRLGVPPGAADTRWVPPPPLRALKKDGKGLSFVYTAFTGECGIAGLSKCLRAFGWADFSQDFADKGSVDARAPRFAVWSGAQTKKEKDIIRAAFNHPDNDDGSIIRAIIGSPSIKEGVSLLRVRYVYLLEGYWNHSRLEQVFGRAIRYCSHKSLPPDQRSVEIVIYAAVAPGPEPKSGADPDPLFSVDLMMLSIADAKRETAEPYIQALKNVAVDRLLGYGRGSPPCVGA